MSQTVDVISMWYNEEYLEPLFLDHYRNARELIILQDAEPDMDDISKAKRLSEAANASDADVRIVVDADEFVYPVTDVMNVEPGEVYVVGFWEVFRHSSDLDIDRDAPPLQQRLHGNPVKGESFGQTGMFNKPVVFGKGVDVELAPGNHYVGGGELVEGCFDGVHWAMADAAVAVHRRMVKKSRQGRVNYENGLTSHDWHVTEDEILRECAAKSDMPWVVNTGRRRFE